MFLKNDKYSLRRMQDIEIQITVLEHLKEARTELECGSVAEDLPSMDKVLGSLPSWGGGSRGDTEYGCFPSLRKLRNC